MKRFLKRKGRGGFSLAECLVALLILSIMSMMACMGISNAVKDRAQAIVIANAQTLASTAAQAVADQVRYGQIVQVDEDSIVLVSSTYGVRVRLGLDAQGHLVAQNVNDSMAAVGPSYALLGDKVYADLILDSLKFDADVHADEVDSVRIRLSVGSEPVAFMGAQANLWALDYTVAPLNTYMA